MPPCLDLKAQSLVQHVRYISAPRSVTITTALRCYCFLQKSGSRDLDCLFMENSVLNSAIRVALFTPRALDFNLRRSRNCLIVAALKFAQ